MTVGEMIDELMQWPVEWELALDDGREFFRMKRRGKSLVQLETYQKHNPLAAEPATPLDWGTKEK